MKNIYEVHLTLRGDMHDTLIVKLSDNNAEFLRARLKGQEKNGTIVGFSVERVERVALTESELMNELEVMGVT